MDLSKQFSLTDILAFFFPGLFTAVGIYLLLLLTPLQPSLISVSANIAASIIFLALSYVVGVMVSSFSMDIVEWIEKVQKYKSAKDTIPFEGLRDDVMSAFNDVFYEQREKNETQWSNMQFYLCRSLILEKMQTISQRIERQGGLRQFRANLIIPILIWLAAGVSWGIWGIYNGIANWGTALIVFSVIIGISSLRVTITRMHKNEWYEVREVVTGFLAGYKAGVFKKQAINLK